MCDPNGMRGGSGDPGPGGIGVTAFPRDVPLKFNVEPPWESEVEGKEKIDPDWVRPCGEWK